MEEAVLCKQPQAIRHPTAQRRVTRAARKQQLAERFYAKTGLRAPLARLPPLAGRASSRAVKRRPPWVAHDARIVRTRLSRPSRTAALVEQQVELAGSYQMR
jgi:hypothetical protein